MGEVVYVLAGIVDYEAADIKGVFYSKESAEECIADYMGEEETGGLVHYDGWEITKTVVGERYFHYDDGLIVYCYDEYGREIE